MKNTFKYRLLHITTEENCNQIIEENFFKISKHSLSTIQWLGDGIYFWDGNSEEAYKLGIKLVKNRSGNKGKKLKAIYITTYFENSRHINLDDPKEEKDLIEFADLDDVKFLKKYLDFIIKQNIADNRYANKVGNMLGKIINLYILYLKEKNINVDVVSCSFYYKKNALLLMPDKKIFIRQFCIKNDSLINSLDANTWEVEYI